MNAQSASFSFARTQEDQLLSIICPVYNEQENLLSFSNELLVALRKVCERSKVCGHSQLWEVIFVDDGSNDGSADLLRKLANDLPRFKAIILRKNVGKVAAIQTGFLAANGEVIVTIDGDSQYDPQEICLLIEPILRDKNKMDVVCGWRKKRKDFFLNTLMSRFYNLFLSFFTPIRVHDINSGFVAYRKKALEELFKEGNPFRSLYTVINSGFVFSEIKINHRKREKGKNKFFLRRQIRNFFNFWRIFFLSRLFQRPLQFFSLFALFFIVWILVSGAAIFGIAQLLITKTYLPLILFSYSLFSLLIGQFLLFGLLGELILHTQEKKQLCCVHKQYGFREKQEK